MDYNTHPERQSDSTATVTLVTGERGIGKSTLCSKLHTSAVSTGRSICGIISLAVYDDNHAKVGIDAVNLSTGRTVPLARKDGSIVGSSWSCYTFSDDAMTSCVGSTLTALDEGVDLLILDEIGPLELMAEKGFLPILRFLETSSLPMHTIVVVRPSLHDELHDLFSRSRCSSSIRTVKVTEDNRDSLSLSMPPDAIPAG